MKKNNRWPETGNAYSVGLVETWYDLLWLLYVLTWACSSCCTMMYDAYEEPAAAPLSMAIMLGCFWAPGFIARAVASWVQRRMTISSGIYGPIRSVFAYKPKAIVSYLRDRYRQKSFLAISTVIWSGVIIAADIMALFLKDFWVVPFAVGTGFSLAGAIVLSTTLAREFVRERSRVRQLL